MIILCTSGCVDSNKAANPIYSEFNIKETDSLPLNEYSDISTDITVE